MGMLGLGNFILGVGRHIRFSHIAELVHSPNSPAGHHFAGLSVFWRDYFCGECPDFTAGFAAPDGWDRHVGCVQIGAGRHSTNFPGYFWTGGGHLKCVQFGLELDSSFMPNADRT